MTQARCLLIPSLVAETSSLVAMEALACGTPVIAFRTGALPEIVEHGKTGFVVDDVEGMAAALRRIDEIDPAVCRSTAQERFSAQRMAQRHMERYHEIIRAARPVPAVRLLQPAAGAAAGSFGLGGGIFDIASGSYEMDGR